jgi:F0F1-type ATP synthase membrane subunit b/b'
MKAALALVAAASLLAACEPDPADTGNEIVNDSPTIDTSEPVDQQLEEQAEAVRKQAEQQAESIEKQAESSAEAVTERAEKAAEQLEAEAEKAR